MRRPRKTGMSALRNLLYAPRKIDRDVHQNSSLSHPRHPLVAAHEVDLTWNVLFSFEIIEFLIHLL